MTFHELKPILRTWDVLATMAFCTSIPAFACRAFDQQRFAIYDNNGDLRQFGQPLE